MTTSHPPIIDYEGSRYRTDFWEGRGREYEDLAERHAIRRLLPPTGDVLIEAGAGFGRLADLYQGYRRVVLLDYSFSLLQEARQRWGSDPRFLFVAASIYDLPIADHAVSALVMVRVIHHLQQPALALSEIGRVLQGQGCFLLEYANKRHLKAILRYVSGRQSWNPFDRAPYEFVQLNYDFHPAWMRAQLIAAGFAVEEELAVSNFRLPLLKRLISPARLAALDASLARPAVAVKLSPSVMARCRAGKGKEAAAGFFRCPACAGIGMHTGPQGLDCPDCGAHWPLVKGIYDFRGAVSRETAAAPPQPSAAAGAERN